MTESPLAEMIARANLHDDPLRFVLEHMEASIARLEKIAERDPLSEEALGKLYRSAAIGAGAHVVEMIRASDRRVRLQRAVWWGVSLLLAAVAGYALHP